MTLIPPSPTSSPKPLPSKRSAVTRILLMGALALMALPVVEKVMGWDGSLPQSGEPVGSVTPIPLRMKGGDPYIRALMRTISASESNDPRPYSLIYGGDRFEDFSQHPDRCVPIVAGPNLGDCTTAAGRYQFITSTWLEQAQTYHPNPSGLWRWRSYSFEPEYQDAVVYAWLSDPQAWGVDLAQLLRDGAIEEVLYILSPTWTSLGYGIETNSMSASLPYIYEEMLREELAIAGN